MRKHYPYYFLFVLALFAFTNESVYGQVIDPNDPIITYDPGNPPAIPPADGQIYDWVRTRRLNWDTDSYKAYIYNGMPFRIKFPKNYDPSGNTKYPMILMLHGYGERGSQYDNEYSMYHGGRIHRDAVDNGKFNGFVLYPQNIYGIWGDGYLDRIYYMIRNHFEEINVDFNRIGVHGLSAGGSGSYNIIADHPDIFSAAAPMSGKFAERERVGNFKHLDLWVSQGGRDTKPSPENTQVLVDAIFATGANLRYTIYLNLGHGVWNTHYNEADFFPFFSRTNKVNPSVLTGEPILVYNENNREVYEFIPKFEFCPGETVITRLGVTGGFQGYEWRKNGVLINNANSNEINVTEFGVYDVRINRNGEWTYWSPIPVEVKIKDATITPPIQALGLQSIVLPAPDGSTTARLEVPPGYTSYSWREVGTTNVLSTERYLDASPGQYEVTVTEQFGCSSDYSNPFTVVDANGAGAPPAVSNLLGFAVSKTEVQIFWDQDPNPSNNETGFEIYRSETEGGPYVFLGQVAADETGYMDQGLQANTFYYYIVRAINGNGGSAVPEEAKIKTDVDTTPPTAPLNLRVLKTSTNSIELMWDEATDDVGVYKYDIYKNDLKSIVTKENQATIYNLTEEEIYRFYVKARDLTGNESPASNQVVAATVNNGLFYKYYHGTWNALPDFNTLTPVATGNTENVDISVRLQNDNFAFMWEGMINIPVAGNYTFETYSDDGSKLYIGSYNEANLVVNNDGLHGGQYREGTYNFPNPGTYPIVMTMFEKGGGEVMRVYWKNTAHGVTSRQQIPNSAFASDFQIPEDRPVPPNNLTATAISYEQINLSWSDNSSNETGFQIFRADNAAGPFTPIHITEADETSFEDKGLDAEITYYYRVIALGEYGDSGLSSDINTGLTYEYYETGSLSVLPNFDALTPKTVGQINNFDISVRERNDNFAFRFTGKINIPAPGSYTFYTSSDDGSKLYINGTQVVNNDGLHGTRERSGVISLTPGSHDIVVTFFERGGGEVLQTRYAGPGIGKQLIPDNVLKDPDINATTLPLPPAPNVPTNLVATGISASEISLTWDDNSNNEDGFNIYRSAGNNSNYLLVDTIGMDIQSYDDSELFNGVTYYYKVAAYNAGGESESSEISGITLNDPPELSEIGDLVMRFDTSEDVLLSATDPNGEVLTLEVENLPAFASFDDFGDGTGVITFNPLEANQGNYPGILVRVSDGIGGEDTESFSLNVNSNYVPEIVSIDDIEVEEGDTQQVIITGTDSDGVDGFTWTLTPDLNFVTLTPNPDGTLQMTISPDYIDAGVNFMELTLDDGEGAAVKEDFILNITEQLPQVIVNVNFTYGTYTSSGIWNNTTGHPLQGDNYSNLTDNNGNDSGIGLSIESAWQASGSNDAGMVTGDDSGIYPDNVIRTAYWTKQLTQTFKVYGLDPAGVYNFTFFGSRNATDDRTTIYAIGGTEVSLNAASNTTNTVDINNVSPDTNGEVLIDMRRGGSSVYGYINALVITENIDEGQVPVAPDQVIASFNSETNRVELTWRDRAFDELNYEVYKSVSAPDNYQLVATLEEDVIFYEDLNVEQNTLYYYQLLARNSNGPSAYSETADITVPNIPPVIVVESEVTVEIGSTLEVLITATDGPGETITLTGENLPSFATFEDNSNGNGRLLLAPVIGDEGIYDQVLVKATDSNAGERTEQIKITVVDPDLSVISVNLTGSANYSVPSPWNNFVTNGSANSSISGLVDNTGANSGISVTLLDGWQGVNYLGMSTGDDSGVVPDNAMLSSLWERTTNVKRVQISGLATDRAYNFIFFGSRDGTGNRTTHYVINGTDVTLNASQNINQVARINQVVADVSGEILIQMYKDGAASYGYINALIIESVPFTGIDPTPTNLSAYGLSQTAIGVDWTDNSTDETGFEIWRSDSDANNFNLIDLVSANQTTYTDNDLSPSTRYYYKVRAKFAGDTYSAFSNVGSAATIDHVISINFNLTYPQASPWNNTNIAPAAGLVFSNLVNGQNSNTGISMEVVSESPDYDPDLFGFNGENPFGMITGDDSGVVPDNVMRSSWWMDPLRAAQLRFSGLDLSMNYNFKFFASRDGYGDRNTDYSIEDKTVTLNASYNVNNIVQINGISPDSEGEILVTIATSAGSNFGYLGAIIIEASEGDGSNNANARIASGSLIDDEFGDTKEQLVYSVYPNPFKDEINLGIEIGDDSTLKIKITDLQGRIVYHDEQNGLFQGNQIINIPFDEHVNPGVYLLEVENSNRKIINRIIKQ